MRFRGKFAAMDGEKATPVSKAEVDAIAARAKEASFTVTSVKKGGKVFYLGTTKAAFCYVKTSTGDVGYVYRGFLKAYGAVGRDQIYYCKSKSATVYKKSGKSLKKSGKLYKKQHVIVYEVRGKWAYIKSLSGKSGYVRKSALAKAG